MRRAKFVNLVCISAIILCSSCNPVFHQSNSEPVTAILGAFPKEVITLEEQVTNKKEHIIEEMKFVSGKLKGKKVVIAFTGIGKVNAAMTSTLMIEHFKPNEIIFTGIAGAINPGLCVGDVVIAEKTAQHDLGTLTPAGLENEGMLNPINGKQNPVFFLADKRLLELAEQAAQKVEFEKIDTDTGERIPKVVKGIVVTGDIFASSTAKCIELRKKLGADAVEMEGAAVAQICYQHNVPCLVIRGISDKANEKSLEDVHNFLDLAAKNSAALVAEMVGINSRD